MATTVRGNTQLHLGIAEQGKVLALRGDTSEALRHFREATRMAVALGAQELFFRHYTQCVLETLERMGAYEEVLAFCERAEDHYAQTPPPNVLAELDLATIRQRKGMVLLKSGDTEGAKAALSQSTAGLERGRMPLAETVGRWLASGMHIDNRRVEAEQQRHKYFVVRADAVDASRAIPLPPAIGTPGYRPPSA